MVCRKTNRDERCIIRPCVEIYIAPLCSLSQYGCSSIVRSRNLSSPLTERGDSYGYDYSGGEDEPEDAEGYGALTGQLTSYEEAYNVGQKVLLAGQAASMHARDRHYPRSYDSEGYAADSTDSTEVDMSVYGVRYYT